MSTSALAANAAPASAGSVMGSLLALFMVVLLILAMAWLLRRVLGKRGLASPAIRPVATLAVGHRERVMVVQVGDEQLLIGVTAQQISMLHRLDVPLPEADASAGFAHLLMAMRKGA